MAYHEVIRRDVLAGDRDVGLCGVPSNGWPAAPDAQAARSGVLGRRGGRDGEAAGARD
jgi:hypothetical protein